MNWEERINKLEAEVREQIEGIRKDLAESQKHEWKTGDFALCPDGKVRRVELFINDYKCTITPEAAAKGCIPVPCPPMPELPKKWRFDGYHLINGNTFFKPQTWQMAFAKDNLWGEDVERVNAFCAWIELVGWKPGR